MGVGFLGADGEVAAVTNSTYQEDCTRNAQVVFYEQWLSDHSSAASMPLVEVIMRLVVVALLACYLFLKHRERVLNWSEPEDPANWTGTAIDATKLMPSLERVRQDYLAARHAPSHTVWYRRGLRALVRRTVGQLAYFRDRKPEDDAHEHAA